MQRALLLKQATEFELGSWRGYFGFETVTVSHPSKGLLDTPSPSVFSTLMSCDMFQHVTKVCKINAMSFNKLIWIAEIRSIGQYEDED